MSHPWRDAATEQPGREVEVICEDHEYDVVEVAGYYLADGRCWTDSEGRVLGDVRRWRELP